MKRHRIHLLFLIAVLGTGPTMTSAQSGKTQTPKPTASEQLRAVGTFSARTPAGTGLATTSAGVPPSQLFRRNQRTKLRHGLPRQRVLVQPKQK